MADDKVETISVPFAKTKAGIQLQPGHRTVIVIEDVAKPKTGGK